MFDNTPSGLDALSPSIAMLRNELQQKGVPPGQEAAYFQQKGIPLSPEIMHLIQMNQLLRQQASQPQGNPAPTTVAQDLQNALSQRMQGIAQLPVQNVGRPQAYARGGIVAFAEGGLTDAEQEELRNLAKLQVPAATYGTYSYTPESQRTAIGLTAARYQALKDKQAKYEAAFKAVQAQAAAKETAAKYGITLPPPVAATPAPAPAPAPAPIPAPTLRERIQSAETAKAKAPIATPAPAADVQYPSELTDAATYFKSRAGVSPDAYSAEREKSRADLVALEQQKLKDLQDVKTKSEAQRKSDMWLNLAQSLASNIGHGGSTMGKLGGVAETFAGGAKDINQRYRDLADKQREATYKIQEAAALRKAGDFEAAQKMQEEANKDLYAVGVEKAKYGQKERELAQNLQIHRETNQTTILAHQIAAAAAGYGHRADEYALEEIKRQVSGIADPVERNSKFNELIREYSIAKGGYGAELSAAAKRQTAAEKSIDTFLSTDASYMKMKPEERFAYRQKLLNAALAQSNAGFSATPR